MYIYDNISLSSSMFQTNVVEKIKTHILSSITFPWNSCRLWDNLEKYGTAKQAVWQYNAAQKRRALHAKTTKTKIQTHIHYERPVVNR